MNVFRALNATGYELVNTKSYEDMQALIAFDGTSRRQGWQPPRVYRARATKRQAGKPADLPYAHAGLVMRQSAVDALRDILDAHGEILPLANEDGVELFVFNTRFMIDALDTERSDMSTIEGTDVVKIRSYVFRESVIRGIDIFRIPVGPNPNFFSDRFVERVKAAKLKGTEFIKLWSSDEPTHQSP